MKFFFLFLGFSFGLLLLNTQAAFACNTKNSPLSIQTLASPIQITDGVVQPQQIVIKDPTKSCDFFIAIDGGGGSFCNTYDCRAIRIGGGLNEKIPIQFYTQDQRIIKHYNSSFISSDYLYGKFTQATGDTLVLTFLPVLDFSYPAYANNGYNETFTFTLYAGVAGQGNPKVADSRSALFKFQRSSFADLSLVDTNQPFVSTDATQNLDFGTLTTGESQSFDVVLKFNKGFKLSMSSVNGGRLKHSVQNQFINYTLTLNGTPITLTPTYGLVLSQTGTLSDTAGLRLPTQVTIGTVVPGTPAGTYNDTVNIQVSTGD